MRVPLTPCTPEHQRVHQAWALWKLSSAVTLAGARVGAQDAIGLASMQTAHMCYLVVALEPADGGMTGRIRWSHIDKAPDVS